MPLISTSPPAPKKSAINSFMSKIARNHIVYRAFYASLEWVSCCSSQLAPWPLGGSIMQTPKEEYFVFCGPKIAFCYVYYILWQFKKKKHSHVMSGTHNLSVRSGHIMEKKLNSNSSELAGS